MHQHWSTVKTMRKLYLLFLGMMMAGLVGGTAVIAAPPASSGIEASASGGGHYLVGGSLDVQFAFSAVQYRDGHVAGAFRDRTNDSLGVVAFERVATRLW